MSRPESLDACETARQFDVLVSFVLFRTDLDEVVRAVDQVLRAPIASHVILVDNSVPALDLPEFDPTRVTIIRPGINVGYGSGHNRAFALASLCAPYHIVMNTDVSYDPEVLGALLKFMDDHPEAGLAMPRVEYPDGRVQHLCRLLPTPSDVLARGFFRRSHWAARRSSRYEFHDWTYDRVENFPFLSGCFMVLRRSIVDRIGGFDERFFLYAEDVDLSRRVHDVAETLFVPDVTVVHEYRTLTTKSVRSTLYRLINFGRYFNKWGWLRDPQRSEYNRRAVARVKAGTGAGNFASQ